MLHTHFFSNFSRDIKNKLAIQQTVKIATSDLLLNFYCLLKIMCLLYFAIIETCHKNKQKKKTLTYFSWKR